MAPQPKIQPEGDERWIYLIQRHWMAFLRRAVVALLFGLPAGAGAVYRVLHNQPDFLGRQSSLLDGLTLLLLAVVLAVMLVVAYIYFDWRNDFLIISNKRVILEDRTLFLRYSYETMTLDRVQNVNVRTVALGQLLDFGTITVQASGPSVPIVFDRARRPVDAQKRIMDEVGREKRELDRLRLQSVTQRRLDPTAPPIPVPRADVEQGLLTNPGWLDRFFPVRPMLVNGSTIIWHHHWIVLLRRLKMPLLVAVAWIVLSVALLHYPLLPVGITTTVIFVGGIVLAAVVVWNYEDWRNDVYILEPGRLIDVRRLPFGLSEERKEASLGAIQNVNAASPNLWSRLFGYGNVEIETAGRAGNLTFANIHDPQQVQRTVFEYIERYKWRQKERDWNNAIDIIESYQRSGSTSQP
ncbi:MAG: hypothetical protein NVS4B8_13440 [Herpetosiphon sp.]